MCSGKTQIPFVNNFDAHKYVKTVRSPAQDENVLDRRPLIDLNNIPLSGVLADREGYDPIPQYYPKSRTYTYSKYGPGCQNW